MKGIIFDLDGTLINSLTDIALCMNEVLNALHYPTHKITDYNYFVGDGAWVLSQNVLPTTATQNEIQKVFEAFKKRYDLNIYENTQPYEGVLSLLNNLEKENFKLGILSNKPHKFTLQYAKKFFGDVNIQEIHGQKEHIEKKPNPTAAISIANNFNLQPKEIFYVGDTATDMKTATNAQMKSIGVSWGFRPISELIENKADFIAHTPEEIYDIVMRLKS